MERNELRETRTVIEDHLGRRLRGDFDGDLEANYAAGVVFIEPSGIYFGHAGLRRAADAFRAALPDARVEYLIRVTVGEMGYVVWRASASQDRRVDDGVDTFVVEGGKIVAQTRYYVIRSC